MVSATLRQMHVLGGESWAAFFEDLGIDVGDPITFAGANIDMEFCAGIAAFISVSLLITTSTYHVVIFVSSYCSL